MPTTASPERKRQTPEWKLWRRHVIDVRKLIRRFDREVSPHGRKWNEKMIAHWQRRLDELLKQEPKRYQD